MVRERPFCPHSWICRRDPYPDRILLSLLYEPLLQVRQIVTSHWSKSNLHICNLIGVLLDLADGEWFLTGRMHGDLVTWNNLELPENVASVVIVDGLRGIHVLKRNHIDYSVHFYIFGILFPDLFWWSARPVHTYPLHLHCRAFPVRCRLFPTCSDKEWLGTRCWWPYQNL